MPLGYVLEAGNLEVGAVVGITASVETVKLAVAVVIAAAVTAATVAAVVIVAAVVVVVTAVTVVAVVTVETGAEVVHDVVAQAGRGL